MAAHFDFYSPVVKSPKFSSHPIVSYFEPVHQLTPEEWKAKELEDEKTQFENLKHQWMDTHQMSEADFDADEDLNAYLHSKAWKIAKTDTAKNKEIERLKEENRLKQKKDYDEYMKQIEDQKQAEEDLANKWKNESELERLEEELKIIEDDAKEIGLEFENDIEEEIPTIDEIEQEYQDLGGFTWSNIWEWVIFFRWIINAVFLAFPFSLYLLFTVIWNVYLNTHFNRYWAGGNLYLLLNTVYNVVQAFNCIWLVFEVPVYLDWFKLTRVFSFESAIFYNLIYFWFMWKTYQSIFQYDYATMGPPSAFEAFLDMTLVYNLIMHIWIVPINIMTISKEIELEYLNTFSDWAAYDRVEDEYSLGEDDAYDLFIGFFKMLNPLTYVDWFWWFWFGYSFYDLFR